MIPTVALAGWQVTKPNAAVPNEPFFQTGYERSNAQFSPHMGMYSSYVYARPQLYAISVSGSLKENIQRIMDRYHWRVIWRAPFDFNFDGRVTGNSLPDVIRKLLQPFPLQAQMYMSNRTMIVVQRKS